MILRSRHKKSLETSLVVTNVFNIFLRELLTFFHFYSQNFLEMTLRSQCLELMNEYFEVRILALLLAESYR